MTLKIDLKGRKLFTYKIYDIKNLFKRKAVILRLKMVTDSLNLKWGQLSINKLCA